MDWFETLTGFREAGYEATRAKLAVEQQYLRSRVNGRSYRHGDLELVSLEILRARAKSGAMLPGQPDVRIVQADVAALHRDPANAGALFQVASQFNLLEMTSPNVTPEDGVTRYESDHTQGPACAIAAGAATIYRNYFAPLDGEQGQTATKQFDALHDFGEALSLATNIARPNLWTMQNGYALATRPGLEAITRYLLTLSPAQADRLRAKLQIGLHRDVEVTQSTEPHRQLVSQAFCSALPVAYSHVPSVQWANFAVLVLEAAYEATLWAAVLNAQRGVSNSVFLTLLGGGAFGNSSRWIIAAIAHAIDSLAGFGLAIRCVSYGVPPLELVALVDNY